MAMNLLITAAEKEARGPKMGSGIRPPPIRGYMDDHSPCGSEVGVKEEVIPSIEENPIKCLGKWFDGSLTDGNTGIEKQTGAWLRRIEKIRAPGKD